MDIEGGSTFSWISEEASLYTWFETSEKGLLLSSLLLELAKIVIKRFEYTKKLIGAIRS